MKTEISRNSHQLKKRYSGIYQQQGRMLTDADWNELVDILKDNVSESLKDVVGNRNGSVGGTPRHRSVTIIKANVADPLEIDAGVVYVDGHRAKLIADPNIVSPSSPVQLFEYTQQLDFPTAPNLIADCFVYVDVWERTVTHLFDDQMRDLALNGADTCSRKQMVGQIKFSPMSIVPETSSKNPAKGSAPATITLLKKTIEPDPCDPCAELIDVDTQIGNYLFRLEVHSVEGDADNPDAIVLKWSAENAAVQYGLKDSEGADVVPPADFTQDNWLYEFFDQESEQHLGVHLADPVSWTPTRGNLVPKTYSVPGASPNEFVRRWDGNCRLIQAGGIWTVDTQFDRALSDSSTFCEIVGNSLTISLDSHEILLKLDESFVAGDFWLAEVRQAKNQPGDLLIEEKPPEGICHYYLTLGEIASNVLIENSQQDRKYAFPSLTELTRTFMAGGDGQEIMPGDPLPETLKVGVANGEWPVVGATVRFENESADGSINLIDAGLTNASGIARCEWTPGTALGTVQRVKATLVNPKDPTDLLEDIIPPLFFSANLISAEQVAYEPGCTDLTQNRLHSRLVNDVTVDLDLGADAYYSVKEVLDALLCGMRAKHIPFDTADNLARWGDVNAEEPGSTIPETVQEAIDTLLNNLHSEDITYTPACTSDTPPTIRSLLNIPTANSSRVHEIFNKILCEMSAAEIPIDRSNLCPDLLSLTGPLQVDTIQDAINALCAKESDGGCCQIIIKSGDNLIEKIAAEIGSARQITICIESGEFILPEPLVLSGLDFVSLSGCNKGTLIRCDHHESAIIFESCNDVRVNTLRVITGKTGSEESDGIKHINGSLSLLNVNDALIEQTYLQCGHGGALYSACLSIFNTNQSNHITIRDNQLAPGNMQNGISIVNGGKVHISNNQIKVRRKSNKLSLVQWLKNKNYRLTLSKILLDQPTFSSSPSVEAGETRLRVDYQGKQMMFVTQAELRQPWNRILAIENFRGGMKDLEFKDTVAKMADRIILQLAGAEIQWSPIDVSGFQSWWRSIKDFLPAFGSQGVVCGGTELQNLQVSDNQILGFSQGVHIGLSNENDDTPFYFAQKVRIENNDIGIYETAQKGIDWHGIYCGNFKFLQIKNNHLSLSKFPGNLDTRVEGVQVHGIYGDLLQIKDNRTDRFSPGIYAKSVGVIPKPKLWQVENNLAAGASSAPHLIPSVEFIVKDNIS